MPIEISEESGVRSLHFGTPWIQGSMRIARPWSLELEYTQHMMWPLLHFHQQDWPQRVLMIGLGSGSMLKFLYRYRPQCRMTVVEIDPQVVHAAHHHFKVPQADQRLSLEMSDGVQYIEKDNHHYDLILVDGFDHNARAHKLESEAFYLRCRQHLRPQGMLACNLLTLHKSHATTKRNLLKVFKNGFRLLPWCEDGNVVAVAQNSDWQKDNFKDQREAAKTLRKATHLNLLPLISQIESLGL
jgi:spermidine synthase